MTGNIAIFGGTFSPPHAGHIRAARIFYDAVSPDKLLIVPTCIPPHKEPVGGASDMDRLAMCALAFSDFTHTEISDTEMRRGGMSYTSDTLRALSGAGTNLHFLVGEDMMLTLDRWHEPEALFTLATLWCIRRYTGEAGEREIREKNEFYEKTYGARVRLIQDEPLVVSSDEIRARIRANEPTDGLLSPSVRAYIDERGLYR